MDSNAMRLGLPMCGYEGISWTVGFKLTHCRKMRLVDFGLGRRYSRSAKTTWGCSSAGRAVRSQRTGRGFESHRLHHFARLCLCFVTEASSREHPEVLSVRATRSRPNHVGRQYPRCRKPEPAPTPMAQIDQLSAGT